MRTLIFLLSFLICTQAWATTKLRTSYTDYCQDANIEHCYRFNADKHDRVLDEYGSNDATINGATYTAAKEGNGYSFDGGDWLHTTLPSLGGAEHTWSVVMWVKPATVADETLISDRATDNWGYKYRVAIDTTDGNTFTCGAYTGTGAEFTYVDSTTAPEVGTWTHVACTHDNGTAIKIYINGVEEDTDPTTRQYTHSNTAAIGRWYGQAIGTYTTATLDELAFFSDVLTAAEITDIYNNGLK